MLSNNLNPADQPVVASRSPWGPLWPRAGEPCLPALVEATWRTHAKGRRVGAENGCQSRYKCLLIPYSGWLYLQGAKFKYLSDKVHNINSLKLIQEIEKRQGIELLLRLKLKFSNLCSLIVKTFDIPN